MQSCNHIVIIHILFSLFVFTLMFHNVGFSLRFYCPVSVDFLPCICDSFTACTVCESSSQLSELH